MTPRRWICRLLLVGNMLGGGAHAQDTSGSTGASFAERAQKLRTDVEAALSREPHSVRELETLCTAWQPRRVLDEQPSLEVKLRLCAGVLGEIQGRLDTARQRYTEARDLAVALTVSDESRALEAEARFRMASLLASEVRDFTFCGHDLGLVQLSHFEGISLGERLERAADAFFEVVRVGSPIWTRRAFLRLAVLYDDTYRQVALSPPRSYRATRLPAPFAFDTIDAGAVLRTALAPKAADWPREVARLYELLKTQRDAPTDETLDEELRTRYAAFAALDDVWREQARNPWSTRLADGAIRRRATRFERRQADGAWSEVPADVALPLLQAALAGNARVGQAAYALVALSESMTPPDDAAVIAALESDDPDVQLAGVLAAENAPRATLYEPLVALWTRTMGAEAAPSTEPPTMPQRFHTLQGALFGIPERLLLALRALATRVRDVSTKMAADGRLPMRERAWIVAELGDTHLLGKYQEFAQHWDPEVAGIGLYASYLASGSRMFWLLRPDRSDVVGCISRRLQALDSKPPSRLELDGRLLPPAGGG